MNNEFLTLYIGYEYLPVRQQANILHAIDNLYSAVAEAQEKHCYDIPKYMWRYIKYEVYPHYGNFLFAPPLCIDSAKTGTSIEFKFSVDQKVFPKCVFRRGDLRVLLPRWYAPVAVTASLLIGVSNLYDHGVTTYKNTLEVEKLQLELKALKAQKSPVADKIDIHSHQFKQEINYSNITQVKVNNYLVKGDNQ